MTVTVRWEVTHLPDGRIDVFPVNFDRSNLRNVTRVTDRFSRYINERTGDFVDCAEFYRLMEQEQLYS